MNNLVPLLILAWCLPLAMILAINMISYSEKKRSEMLELLNNAGYLWQGSAMSFEALPIGFFRSLGFGMVVVGAAFLLIIMLVEPHSELSEWAVSLVLLLSLILQFIVLWLLLRLRVRYKQRSLKSRFLFVNAAQYLGAAPKGYILVFFPIQAGLHLLMLLKFLF